MANTKEKYKSKEEQIQALLKKQERLTKKWQTELNNSMRYFERVVGDLNSQIKTLKKQYCEQGNYRNATLAGQDAAKLTEADQPKFRTHEY